MLITARHPAAAGVLACLDGYMNIAMEQTEEYVNGQLKNKYGDCFIRGNNGELAVTWCRSQGDAGRARTGLGCPPWLWSLLL